MSRNWSIGLITKTIPEEVLTEAENEGLLVHPINEYVGKGATVKSTQTVGNREWYLVEVRDDITPQKDLLVPRDCLEFKATSPHWYAS